MLGFRPREWCAEYESTSETLAGGVIKQTNVRRMNNGVRLIVGILTLGLNEILSTPREETYKYYYENEYLGTTRNEAASAAYTRGVTLTQQEQFQNAERWFNAGYHTCTSDYTDEQQFLNSRNATQIAASAKILYNSGRFREAAAKYQEAYNLSNVPALYRIFSQCRDTATNAAERQEAEYREAQRRDAERREAERRDAERREAERRDAERREAERRDAERREAERRDAERRESERRKAEHLESQRRELEYWEAQHREAQRREDERREAQRREAQRQEAQFQRAQRQAAEYLEAQRGEDELREAQRREDEHKEAERREADQSEEVEALKLHQEGLRLYHDGKAKEAAKKIVEAINIFEQAASQFDEAIKKKDLDIFFISYVNVVQALMKNGAYEEARTAIEKVKCHFPGDEKKQILEKIEKVIDDESWSPDCLSQYLTTLERSERQIIQNNNWSPSD